MAVEEWRKSLLEIGAVNFALGSVIVLATLSKSVIVQSTLALVLGTLSLIAMDARRKLNKVEKAKVNTTQEQNVKVQ